jgi:chaperonin GroES
VLAVGTTRTSQPTTATDIDARRRVMSKRQVKPLGDRLVVEPIEREERTASGIILPETAKEKPQEGRVLSVGPGRRDDDGNRVPMDVKRGDKVLYAKYAGTEIKIDDQALLILKESDILALIEESGPERDEPE